MRFMRPIEADQQFKARTSELVRATSTPKIEVLTAAVLETRSKFQLNGTLVSSPCVNAVCRRCVTGLRELAQAIFDSIKRAQPPLGMMSAGQISELFQIELEGQRRNVLGVQDQTIGHIAAELGNQSMLELDAVSNAHRELLRQYDAEIELFVEERRRQQAHLLRRGVEAFFGFVLKLLARLKGMR